MNELLKIIITFNLYILAPALTRGKSEYSKGQNYTNISLSVYKSPTRKVVMTSFPEFNVGFRGYQQMPWMVNFDGVGIWSQSGDITKEYHNIYGPSVKQHHNVLLVIYAMYFI